MASASWHTILNCVHVFCYKLFNTHFREQIVVDCVPVEFKKQHCSFIFSAVETDNGATLEEDFANAGFIVISNAKYHRMNKQVPILLPYVNPKHIESIEKQTFANSGSIVTNGNCSTIGLVVVLKALQQFKIRRVVVCCKKLLIYLTYY